MFQERRKLKRFDVIHVIEIKLLHKTNACLLGLTRNFSCEGLSFELLNTDFELKESIEFNLKYPQRKLYVSFVGDAVWKKRFNNKLLAGIKIREMDKENNNKLIEIISAIRNIPVDLISYGKNDKSDLREEEEVKSIAKLSIEEKENLILKTFRKDKRKETWLYVPVVTVIAVVLVFIIFKFIIHSPTISERPTPTHTISESPTSAHTISEHPAPTHTISERPTPTPTMSERPMPTHTISERSTPNIEIKRKTYSPKLKQYQVTRDKNKNSSRTIYTIQTGSFIDIANADEHVKSIIQSLKRETIDDLRIEKVGKYNAVRFGVFEDQASADTFLQAVKPELSTAIVLKAVINNKKIIRLYDKK